MHHNPSCEYSILWKLKLIYIVFVSKIYHDRWENIAILIDGRIWHGHGVLRECIIIII